MSDYSKFIAPERRSVPTPKHMVEDGNVSSALLTKSSRPWTLWASAIPLMPPIF